MKRFFLWALLLTPPAFAGDENYGGYEAPITPYTRGALVIKQELTGMVARVAQVPDEPNQIPGVCFDIPGKQLLQCLYIDKDDQSVTIIAVMPTRTKL